MKTRLSIIKEQVENILEVVLVGKAAQAAVATPAPAGIRMSEAERKAAEKKAAEKLGNEIFLAKLRNRQQKTVAVPGEAKTAEGGGVTSGGNLGSSRGAGGEERGSDPKQAGDKGIGRQAHAGRAHTKTKRQIAAGNLKQGGKRTRFSPRAVPVKTVR